MSERLDNAWRVVETTDKELLELRMKAHAEQQDIAGLTPEQSEILNSFDKLLTGKSIVSEFDHEQQEAFQSKLPESKETVR